MQNQVEDRFIFEDLVSTTNLASLAQGYILNCRCEGKTPKTLSNYSGVLKNLIWYCKKEGCREVNKLSVMHIRQFLSYLGNNANRWGSNNPATRRAANLTTINTYYRVLHSFFNTPNISHIYKPYPVFLYTTMRF